MAKSDTTHDRARALIARSGIESIEHLIVLAFAEERKRCIGIVEETSAKFGAMWWSAEATGIEIVAEIRRCDVR